MCLTRSKAGRCTAQQTLLRFAGSAPVPGSAMPERKRKGYGSPDEGSEPSPATTRLAPFSAGSAAAACKGAGPHAPAGRGQPQHGAGTLCGGVPGASSTQWPTVAAAMASRPADSAVAASRACTEFATFAVGRGLFPPLARQPASGQPLAIVPEPGNPRDANALMVMDPNPCPDPATNPGGGSAAPGAGVGYLPAVVAAVLAPLMAEGLCAADMAVAEAPSSGAAPLQLTLRVLLRPWRLWHSTKTAQDAVLCLIMSHVIFGVEFSMRGQYGCEACIARGMRSAWQRPEHCSC